MGSGSIDKEMGRPRKTPLNGDSKIIYDAVAKVQADISKLVAGVATVTAKGDERHDANLRALENMSGDMHIVLSKVQDMPCKTHEERMKGMKVNINWLWGLLSGTLLFVIGATVKHLMG